MLPSRHFIDLTQPEIAQQLKKNPLVVLPAGSVEQHGPHLPTGTDIRTIAPTGWYGAPEHATVAKGLKMLDDIADAIAGEATEIFRLLDEAQGGTAEIKHLKVAS